MPTDTELRIHRDWIGLLQPVGLVVSPPALSAAQAFPDRNILKEQQALLSLLKAAEPKTSEKNPLATKQAKKLPGFVALAHDVLGWKPGKLAGAPSGPPLPEKLELVLPEFHETLRPTFAVPALKEDDAEWMLLIQELPDGTPFDETPEDDSRRWRASPQVRFERLLRETGVPIGILTNGYAVRLVYAPRGESSGHVTWPVYALGEVAGRLLLSALCMLLGYARLFALPREQRLPHILKESRKYQNVVSTKLAGQVLEALNELLRGFQAANEAAKGRLLDATVREDPDHVYGGLLAVLLRLVFILYAEERGLLSSSAAYVRNYSLVGLFEKLRSDAGRFPDTMDQRYGAWSRLLVLFRMVHDGARRGDLRLPPRYGHLFDPDGWAFLEGRPYRINRVMGAPVEVPKVPDGVVLRVLEKLLLLDSDRLSYRALDVEQIGSVYENMMGFRLEQALETSIGVGKEHVVVGLETLLKKKGSDRERHLKETAGVELFGKAAEALKQAASIDNLVAALSRRISPLTPRAVPMGGLYLQPTDERRRSGSHYTPRELTEPIVRTTLQPILEDLGSTPKPEQILSLKVCDPAMGSGAFLVETCRQLAEQLVKTYDLHGRPTDVPPDEDILLYAQRQVAQHCLYGVDKNPFAVDLGKLSLWLATLARDHAFTFLDHSIRQGDSLVGLSREQVASFHWAPERQISLIRTFVEKAIGEAVALRQKIQYLANSDDVREKRQLLRDADDALTKVRLIGDCAIACFFSAETTTAREEIRKRWEEKAQSWLSGHDLMDDVKCFVEELRSGKMPVPCFHWEIEFPEVFGENRGGFDAFIGNPPFLRGKAIGTSFGSRYRDFITTMYEGTNASADIVAFFYRRAFEYLAKRGTTGLIATKTISKGDTRAAGLRWIRKHHGTIYAARRRIKWPGTAAVVVSVVHISKERQFAPALLDGVPCDFITAFLFDQGGDDDPVPLSSNAGINFTGWYLASQGFLFDDRDSKASPTAVLDRILKEQPESAVRVFPYFGGDELNSTAPISSQRQVIYFGTMTLEEASRWPLLLEVVRNKVKPTRDAANRNAHRQKWWLFGDARPQLVAAVSGLKRYLCCVSVSEYLGFVWLPSRSIVSHNVSAFAREDDGFFAVVQSRPHEYFAINLSSGLEDRPGYRPTDGFLPFPFPKDWETSDVLRRLGSEYYRYRMEIMERNGEGLTKTYSRFHDPDESAPDILRLRELHAEMDRAVLDAYGWTDIQPTCEFLLDYEDEEDDSDSVGGRRKKKPWRYRWSDDIREEVLARLLELNAQRAKEEASSGSSGSPPTSGKTKANSRGRAKGAKKPSKTQANLFGGESK